MTKKSTYKRKSNKCGGNNGNKFLTSLNQLRVYAIITFLINYFGCQKFAPLSFNTRHWKLFVILVIAISWPNFFILIYSITTRKIRIILDIHLCDNLMKKDIYNVSKFTFFVIWGRQRCCLNGKIKNGIYHKGMITYTF